MSNTKITSNVIESGAVTTTHIASGAISASHLTGITTANITENTNLYYTDTRARASISVTGGNLAYDSATGVLQLTDAEIRDALSAGTGITYSSGQFSIGQSVGTSDTVTFGNITTTGYLRGPSNFTIDPAAYGDDTGTLIIAGNLQVDGTTTTINSTTLTVDDLNITLASGAANAAAANGAGITVDGASATLIYTSSDDSWAVNKRFKASSDIRLGSDGVRLSTDGNGEFGVGYGQTATNNRFTVYNNTAVAFRILPNGNVGIGTTSPASALDIHDASATIIVRDTTSAATGVGGAISFQGFTSGTGNPNNFGKIKGTKASGNVGGELTFSTSATNGTLTDRMIIDESGDVGIGTTPYTNARLTIGGTSTSYNSVLQFDNNTTGGAEFFMVASDNTWTAGSNKFLMGHGAPSSAAVDVTINADGNVGIGTTSPGLKLEVDSGSSSDIVKFGNDNGSFILGKTANLASIDLASDADLRIRHGSTISGYFDASGNVGIGETSPDARLEVRSSGTGESTGIRLTDTNGTVRGNLYFGGAQNFVIHGASGPVGADAPALQFATGGSTPAVRMTILEEGDVGIGTPSPNAKLELNVPTGNGLLINSADIATIKMKNTGGGVKNWGFATTNLAAGDFGIYASNSVGGDPITAGAAKLYFTSGGNVGIGTTSPVAPLHVYNPSGGNATDKASMLSEAVVKLQPHITNSTNMLIAQVDGGNSMGIQVTNGPATADWDLSLSPFGGRVGIGTVAPAAALEVARGSAGYAGIFGAPQGSGKVILFKDNHATPNKYNWLVGSQYNINNAFEITPSTVVGGYTFNDPGLSIDETGIVKVKQLHTTATTPMSFLSNSNTGTYNRTVLYSNQSNSSSNLNNGIHIEMGRISDSSSAEVRAFIVGARGGQSSFKVKERQAGVTQADGDYLAKMYELNADGFLSLFTGEATPVERVKISSYGTSFVEPPISSRTSSSRAALSVGTNTGYAAGVLAISGQAANDGMVMISSVGREYRNVCSTHTAAASSRYWHIKTNIFATNNIMFVARVHGYSYGNGGNIVDIQRSGYAYSSHGNLTGSATVNNGSSSDTLDVYFASDNYLCFRHTTPNSGYYNGYSFDIKMQSPTGYNFNFQILANAINNVSGNNY